MAFFACCGGDFWLAMVLPHSYFSGSLSRSSHGYKVILYHDKGLCNDMWFNGLSIG